MHLEEEYVKYDALIGKNRQIGFLTADPHLFKVSLLKNVYVAGEIC